MSLAFARVAVGQTIYTWNNGSGGFWSGANWTPSTPPEGGGQDIRLTFGVSGTYIANNDLSGTFQLNQLLFDGGTPTLTGNPLQLSSWGTGAWWVSNNAATVATVNNDIDFVAGATFGAVGSGTLIFNGALTGTGPLTNIGAGSIVLTGPASYSGLTVVRATGSGAWQGLVLSNTTGGVVIPGDVDVGGGGGANVYLRLGADEQIADSAVLTFNTTANYGRFMLLGRTETVAGIQTTTGRGIVQNTDQNDPYTTIGPATLILAPAAGQSFSFNGYLRNAYTWGGNNALRVVKAGQGTQILAGSNIGNGGLNSIEIQAGVLVLNGTTHSGFTTPLTITGGQLLLASSTAAARNPITNWVNGGVEFSNGVTVATIGSLSGSGDISLQNWDANAVTLFVGSNNLSGTYSGSLSGAGGLRKVGTGTQVLSGNNTYSGQTVLDAGTLIATHPGALPGYGTANRVVVSNAVLGVRLGPGAWTGAEVGALVANASWYGGSRLHADVLSGSETVSADIGGPLRLVKLGTGELVLSGVNSYEGGTGIGEGTLAIASAANLPSSGQLAITGGVLRVLGTALANLDAYTLNTAAFRGGIAVDEASHVLALNQSLNNSAGYLVKDGSGTLLLGGANTLASITNLAGTLRIGSSTALPVGAPLHLAGGSVDLGTTEPIIGNLTGVAGTTITNQGKLQVRLTSPSTFAGSFVGSGELIKTGANTLALSGASPNFTGSIKIERGTLLVSHDQALGSSEITIGTLVPSSPEEPTLSLTGGVVVAGCTLRLVGRGRDFYGALQAAANSSGTWAGTIIIDQDEPGNWFPRLGAYANGVLVVAGNIVDGTGTHIFISGQGGSGKVVLSGTNTYSGDTGIIRGILELGRSGALPATTRLRLGVATTTDRCVVNMNGYDQSVAALQTENLQGLRAITNTAGTMSTLTVHQSVDTTFAGVLGGPLSLVKQGSGTLTLTGTNVHTGVTRVDGGTLQISGNGSVHQSPKIIVGAAGTLVVPDGYTLRNGQRLEGNGTVQGGLIVGSGAILAPGTSAGTLTVQNNLVFTNGSVFEVELFGLTAGTEFDQLLLSGTELTLYNPSLNVLLGFTPSLGDSFQIVSGFSTLTGTFDGLPHGSTFTVGGTQFQIDYNASDITLTVVPEPGTLVSLSLVFAASVLLRRRLTLRGRI